MLLRSRPDTVHGFLLRKTQTSTSLIRGSSAVLHPRFGITPAVADCRYRAPLTPRLHGNIAFLRQNLPVQQDKMPEKIETKIIQMPKLRKNKRNSEVLHPCYYYIGFRGVCQEVLFCEPLRQRWRKAAAVFSDIYGTEINLQIIINHGFDSLRESIFCGIIRLKRINHDPVFLWINNPVFTNSCSAVFEQFRVVVHAPAVRGDDLNDPVRRTCAAFVCELVSAAYNAYIRFDIVFYHLHSEIRQMERYLPHRSRLFCRCSQQSCG